MYAVESTFRASRMTQYESVPNRCYACDKAVPGLRGLLRREYKYFRVDLSFGSTLQHASHDKPCNDILSLPVCVKFEPQSCRKTSCLALFRRVLYAQGDTSFRSISAVQSVRQHSVPDSKSRFRSRVLLFPQFHG